MIPVPAAASAEGDAKDNNASGRAIESTRGQMHAALRALLATLTEKEAQLSAWDAQVGDGDCGQQWRSGITGLVDGANAGKVDDVLSVRSLQQCADMLADSMGGTSGAICQIFFRAAAAGLRADPSPGNAFAAGLKAICTYGRAREGMRTMVDALAPASTILASGGSMSEAAAAAAKGAEATKAMSAGAGRSSYVREEMLRQVPDPGAWAVAWVLQTLASL
jgi:dihydroxyacetone kinase